MFALHVVGMLDGILGGFTGGYTLGGATGIGAGATVSITCGGDGAFDAREFCVGTLGSGTAFTAEIGNTDVTGWIDASGIVSDL